MCKLLCLLAIVLTLPVLPLSAQDKKVQPEVYTEIVTGVKFPAILGGFIRGKEHHYGDGLGVSIPYNLPGAAITIYLYDMKRKDITNGIESKIVIAELERAKRDILTAQKQGSYRSVKLIKEDQPEIGASKRKLLRASYEIVRQEGEVKSQLLITGYQKHFFKIRCTYSIEGAAGIEKSLAHFYQELGNVLDEAEKK